MAKVGAEWLQTVRADREQHRASMKRGLDEEAREARQRSAEVLAAKDRLQESVEACSEQSFQCSVCACAILDTLDSDATRATFKCAQCNSTESVSSSRTKEERQCAAAIKALDSVQAPTPKSRETQQLQRGVRLGWLKRWMVQHGCHDLRTFEVVRNLIQPLTSASRCRFCELDSVETGVATIFVSHTWGGRFGDLVAAVNHALCGDNEKVLWIDIFAVRQWPGNTADVTFTNIVRDTEATILVSNHLNSLVDRDPSEGIPPDAFRVVAFFRVWCLVELNEALIQGKPVAMLIGEADEDGVFCPNVDAIGDESCGMMSLIDVRYASATKPSDRDFVMEIVQQTSGYSALNSLARGALNGADVCMSDWPEVLLAACGASESLMSLPRERRHLALRAAAAGGFAEVCAELLADGADVMCSDDRNETVLHEAAFGGHVKLLAPLVRAGAAINEPGNHDWTPLHNAAMQGHVACVEELLRLGADAKAVDDEGCTPWHIAERYRHAEALLLLPGPDE